MPIMQASECKENFDKILMAALVTLAIVYIGFSEICYITFGTEITHTFITEEDPLRKSGAWIMLILQGLYSINLVCSYAIFIFPANTIIEDVIFKSLKRKEEDGE